MASGIATLRFRNRHTLDGNALNVMRSATGAQAFTATIDPSNTMEQEQCPLFSKIPSEIRSQIFAFACTSSDDLSVLYEADRVYYRPNLKNRLLVERALLQTCKRIFHETRLKPVAETEHTFWLLGGPLRARRARRYAMGDFGAWQRSLNDDQKAAVTHVRLFAQQYYLEGMGVSDTMSGLRFQTKVFTITFRNSDWWSWESPPESTDRLGICPWLPHRVSHQEMVAQPCSPSVQELEATMVKGTWGWQIGELQGLEVFRIEFEIDIAKKSQMKVVLERAKHWRFLLHDTEAVLEQTGEVRESEWIGQDQLRSDNTPTLRHVTTGAEPLRTYFVAEMTWKKRSLTAEEMGR